MAAKKEVVKETAEKAVEAVKAEAAEVKESVKKAAKKTTTAAKKATTAAKKTTTAAKKTVKKAAEKVEKKAVADAVVLEFADKQIEMKAVLEACKADYKAQTKKTAKGVQVYVKPEDNKAYYVVGDFTCDVDL